MFYFFHHYFLLIFLIIIINVIIIASANTNNDNNNNNNNNVLSPLDLQMVFQGMKNGSTVYVDDVENNGWSISIYPHQNNDVRLLVKKNGKFLKNYRKGTRYVDSIIGMHHIEAIAVFQTHVVRRQLYYTILILIL